MRDREFGTLDGLPIARERIDERDTQRALCLGVECIEDHVAHERARALEVRRSATTFEPRHALGHELGRGDTHGFLRDAEGAGSEALAKREPRDRRELHQRARRLAERREPTRDQLRERARTIAVGAPREMEHVHEGAGLPARGADELTTEHGVEVGMEPLRERVRFGVVEGREAKGRRLRRETYPAKILAERPLGDLARPDEEHTRRALAAEHAIELRDAVGVGPLEVRDDHDDEPLARDLREHTPERIEGARATLGRREVRLARSGLRERWHATQHREDVGGVLDVARQPAIDARWRCAP